jgi:hypothetical protein
LLLDPENETITEEDTSGIAWKMFYAFIMWTQDLRQENMIIPVINCKQYN